VIDRTIQSKVEFTRQLTAQTRQLARQYQESQRLAAQLEAMNVELQRSLADAERAKRELSEQHDANLELQRVAREEVDTARWLAGVAETTAALAHEINNPLTALIMNVELLESPNGDQAEESIQEIRTASRRIATVVKRLTTAASHRSVKYLGERLMLDLSPEE
jgi:signal transduction histidine kinase